MRAHNLIRRPASLVRALPPLPRQPIRPPASTTRAKSSVPVPPPPLFQLFLERYNAALNKNPLLVKASAASIIFFASDSATQHIMEPDKDFDLARAGSGSAFGVLATSWLHYWWGFLEVTVNKRLPPSTHRLSNTLTKVFVDQALGAPLYIFTYFVITNFLQDLNAAPEKSWDNSKQLLDKTCNKAKDMLPPTMMRHWTLWPAVHTFNFYYMPLHHRVLVQNLVLVGWSGYLSHLNNGGLMTPDGEMEVTQELIRRKTLRQANQHQHTEAAAAVQR